MKKIYFLACLVLLAATTRAQVDRTKAPLPAAAREIKIGDYQTFTLKNGLQVFVVENHKLPRVQFSVQLRNDAILEGPKAGYVDMAGDLIGTGTKTKTKAQLDEEVDFLGATLNTSATSIFALSLTKHSVKLLDLMTDVLYNPAFSQEEMDKLKTQTLSGLAAGKENPTVIAGNVRSALVYGKNHPYGEVATEQTVNAITLDDCKNYFNTYFKPNNAFLIIVGDIDLKTAKSHAEKYFAKWTAGDVKNPVYTPPQAPAKTFVALVDRPSSVQSVVNITYPVELKPGTQEVIKARVTNQILGGSFSARLMQNLREKHGYTYGASSQLSPDNLMGSFNASASVRNAVTDSSVGEFINELKKISATPVTDQELASAKASIAGAFGRSLESPQTIASFALNTAKYNLPKDYYNNYLKYIDAITVADVQTSAAKYIKPDNAYIIVVGKGSEVADKLKRFGEIKYYDVNGDSYVPSKASTIPAGVTAEKVIASYIDAIGGAKKIGEIKTIKITSKASAGGMELAISGAKKAPNKSVGEITANGMTFQKIISDGKNVSMAMMGQKPPVDDKTKEETLYEAGIVPEANLAALNVKAVLTEVEAVDGQDAYVVEYTFPAGGKTTVYFDKTTGLKVQSTKTVEGPQGVITIVSKYQDYKDEGGVKFAHTIIQVQGPMTIKAETVKVEVNVPLDDAIFKIEP